jgi:hypothetical protein
MSQLDDDDDSADRRGGKFADRIAAFKRRRKAIVITMASGILITLGLVVFLPAHYQ